MFEIGEIVIHSVNGKHGRVISRRETKSPLVEVRWKDLSTDWLPEDMLRKRDNLPIPARPVAPRRNWVPRDAYLRVWGKQKD